MPRTRDGFTNGVWTLDAQAAKAFRGQLWSTNHTNSALATASNLDIQFRTGASNIAVPTALVVASQPITWTLFEASTFSADGTALTVYNRNRGTAGSPTATVFHTPTVTAAGTTTLINGLLVPANAIYPLVASWQLAANTRYLLRGNNASGSSAAVSVLLSWYEQ